MYDVEYPDMKLYQEIIFLQNFFSGKYCVENVIPYYIPLIKPQEIGRHLCWANFSIPKIKTESNYIFNVEDEKRVKRMLGFDLDNYNLKDKTKILRNCVVPELGKLILDRAMDIKEQSEVLQTSLFQ